MPVPSDPPVRYTDPPVGHSPCIPRVARRDSQHDGSVRTAVALYERLESASDPPLRVDVNALCSVYIGRAAPMAQAGARHDASLGLWIRTQHPRVTVQKRHQTCINASFSKSRFRPPFARRPTPEARSPRADRGPSRSTRDPRCGSADAIAPPTNRSSASGASPSPEARRQGKDEVSMVGYA